MKYIIQVDSEYYLGNTYRYQYSTFASLGKKEKAKRYKSKKLAMKAADTLHKNCAESYKYLILEVEE